MIKLVCSDINVCGKCMCCVKIVQTDIWQFLTRSAHQFITSVVPMSMWAHVLTPVVHACCLPQSYAANAAVTCEYCTYE